MEEETYTTGQAARILKVTPGRIHQMLRAGELEGVPPCPTARSTRTGSKRRRAAGRMGRMTKEPKGR